MTLKTPEGGRREVGSPESDYLAHIPGAIERRHKSLKHAIFSWITAVSNPLIDEIQMIQKATSIV